MQTEYANGRYKRRKEEEETRLSESEPAKAQRISSRGKDKRTRKNGENRVMSDRGKETDRDGRIVESLLTGER